MSNSKKRKHILFASLAVSLAAAMFVNWYYTRPVDSGTPSIETTQAEQVNLGDAQFVNAAPADSYFEQAQLSRSRAQDEARQNLTAIIGDASADPVSKQSASDQLGKLTENVLIQNEIESYISAKSGGKVLVSLSGTAEVILEKGTFSEELALQIKDIITRKTEISAEKITIIESK